MYCTPPPPSRRTATARTRRPRASAPPAPPLPSADGPGTPAAPPPRLRFRRPDAPTSSVRTHPESASTPLASKKHRAGRPRPEVVRRQYSPVHQRKHQPVSRRMPECFHQIQRQRGPPVVYLVKKAEIRV